MVLRVCTQTHVGDTCLYTQHTPPNSPLPPARQRSLLEASPHRRNWARPLRRRQTKTSVSAKRWCQRAVSRGIPAAHRFGLEARYYTNVFTWHLAGRATLILELCQKKAQIDVNVGKGYKSRVPVPSPVALPILPCDFFLT